MLTALVKLIRLALKSPPSRERASIRAITLAAIASYTNIRRYATASAKKTADCLLHRRTTLNRRATSHAALMLHSGAYSDVVSSQPSPRQQRLPHCSWPCPCQYPSVLSAVKNSRAILAAAYAAFLTSPALRGQCNDQGHRDDDRNSGHFAAAKTNVARSTTSWGMRFLIVLTRPFRNEKTYCGITGRCTTSIPQKRVRSMRGAID